MRLRQLVTSPNTELKTAGSRGLIIGDWGPSYIFNFVLFLVNPVT